MKHAVLVALAALIVLAATAEGALGHSTGVHLFFVSTSGRTLLPVVRVIPSATPRSVVAAIVAGPNGTERAQGATAVVSRGVQLLRVRKADNRVSVALRGSSLVRLSTIPRLRVIASLTYTLTGLPGVHSVHFVVNGRPWGVYNLKGRIIRDYSRSTLRPGMNACAPADGCFSP